jgi:hypothetical protein
VVQRRVQQGTLKEFFFFFFFFGEQGTEALVRYINENSVENHHHYNSRSLPYSKVFIA